MTVTQNELELLAAIRDSEFHDGSDPVGNPVWVDCLWGWSGTRKFPGTMASLVRKGLAHTDGECCSITAAGLAATQVQE